MRTGFQFEGVADPARPGWLRPLPAGLKLGVALGLVLLILALPARGWIGYGLVALLVGVLAVLSGIPARFLLRRLLWLEPFVLGVALLALFQPDGWRVAGTLVLKSTLCLGTMILLSGTTPFAELLQVLRRARVPPLLVTTLALLYRYLFVLLEEAERMRRARASRTFTRRRWPTWQALASVTGQLFVRSSERAERIYAAMCARGWQSGLAETPVPPRPKGPGTTEPPS